MRYISENVIAVKFRGGPLPHWPFKKLFTSSEIHMMAEYQRFYAVANIKKHAKLSTNPCTCI